MCIRDRSDAFVPLQIYSPKKGIKASSINPLDDFIVLEISPSCVVEVQQDFDNLAIVPIAYARQLLEEPVNVSAIEIDLNKGINADKLKTQIEDKLGKEFIVKNRIQQNQALYNVLSSEKSVSYTHLDVYKRQV